MTVMLWLAGGGAAVMLLALVAMAVAPKGSGSGDPDDDAVVTWAAVMFFAGFVFTLWVLAASWLAERHPGLGEWEAFGLIGAGLAVPVLWGLGIRWLYRRSHP